MVSSSSRLALEILYIGYVAIPLKTPKKKKNQKNLSEFYYLVAGHIRKNQIS
jgi:hypothetical protein